MKDGPYEKLYELGKDLKTEVMEWGYTVDDIQEDGHLIHAAEEMDMALTAIGYADYDLDSLRDTLLAVYDVQQGLYRQEKGFSLLSLISMALLELGILVEEDDETV